MVIITLIGYIHVCQKGEWKKSFKMLIDAIRKSGLYEKTYRIRLGIVNDTGFLIDDEILNDEKFDIIYIGKCEEYERPTLLSLRNAALKDRKYTFYYYLHTKGIKHFGTKNEDCIIDWINLMLYWNIEKWRFAIQKLQIFDTYGCNDTGHHYSGNFWWATRKHILKLPNNIDTYYTAPENWIQLIKNNKFSAFNSGFEGMGHYTNRFPRYKYCID